MVAIPARLKPIPSEVKVNVYNTTYKTGLAKTVADAVAARGFKVKDVSNDPLRTMQLGTAVIRYGEEGDLAAALLKGHVPGRPAGQGRPPRRRRSTSSSATPAPALDPDRRRARRCPPRPKQPTPTVARPCRVTRRRAGVTST